MVFNNFASVRDVALPRTLSPLAAQNTMEIQRREIPSVALRMSSFFTVHI